ncbi:MAG: hypothetical protein ACPG19_11765 [Saprospiraceae bacterium]
MKHILILFFTLFTFSVFSQDTSNFSSKNQIGIDVLPAIIGLSTPNNGIFDRLELSYRRAFSSKYSGAVRMKFGNSYLADYRIDTTSTDTIGRYMTYIANNSVELSFVFSRKFSFKKVNFYTGLIASFSRVRGYERTYPRALQLAPIPSLTQEILYNENQSHIRLGYGLEVGFEVLMTQRFSLLLNTKAMIYHNRGSWNYLNFDDTLTEVPIKSSDFEFLPFSSAMLLYRL